MTKGALVKAIAGEFEIKTKQASKVINSIAGIASHEVASIGKFTLPGLFRIKSRQKPATKATKREIFGKICLVKARPAFTIVLAGRAFTRQILPKISLLVALVAGFCRLL